MRKSGNKDNRIYYTIWLDIIIGILIWFNNAYYLKDKSITIVIKMLKHPLLFINGAFVKYKTSKIKFKIDWLGFLIVYEVGGLNPNPDPNPSQIRLAINLFKMGWEGQNRETVSSKPKRLQLGKSENWFFFFFFGGHKTERFWSKSRREQIVGAIFCLFWESLFGICIYN